MKYMCRLGCLFIVSFAIFTPAGWANNSGDIRKIISPSPLPADYRLGPKTIVGSNFAESFHRTFIVTSNVDSGPGSLREVLEILVSKDQGTTYEETISEQILDPSAQQVTVYFDVPGGIIKPTKALPVVRTPVNFIGPVSLDASAITEEVPLLFVYGANCTFNQIHFQNAVFTKQQTNFWKFFPREDHKSRRIISAGYSAVVYFGGEGPFIECIFDNNKTIGVGSAVLQFIFHVIGQKPPALAGELSADSFE
jgi:hypothetical protein